jgi:nitrile hydratase subunit beta
MNGIHDMGGMDGFGPVVREENEPVFHADWEKRMFAIASALPFSLKYGDDHFRREIERIPAEIYLSKSYYEYWNWAIKALLVERKLLSVDGLASYSAGTQKPLSVDAVRAKSVELAVFAGASTRASQSQISKAFKVGDRVRVRNSHPHHHTRLPRYVRGHVGQIILDHGIFNFPDSNSQYLGECPQHCYTVEFSSVELWGENSNAQDFITVDLWQSYLQPAHEVA